MFHTIRSWINLNKFGFILNNGIYCRSSTHVIADVWLKSSRHVKKMCHDLWCKWETNPTCVCLCMSKYVLICVHRLCFSGISHKYTWTVFSHLSLCRPLNICTHIYLCINTHTPTHTHCQYLKNMCISDGFYFIKVAYIKNTSIIM